MMPGPYGIAKLDGEVKQPGGLAYPASRCKLAATFTNQFDNFDFVGGTARYPIQIIDTNNTWRKITGFADGFEGRSIYVQCLDANTAGFVLLHENTSSRAENRIKIADGASFTLYPGKPGVWLIYDDTIKRWRCPAQQGVINSTGATLDVVNTTNPTSLYNFTIQEYALGTNKAARVTVLCDYLNNSGAARTFTLRVLFGGAIWYEDVSISLGVSTARRAIGIIVWVGAANSVSSQVLHGSLTISSPTAPTTGYGDIGANVFSSQFGGNPTQDGTLFNSIDVTILHSVANASLSMRRRFAMIELM